MNLFDFTYYVAGLNSSKDMFGKMFTVRKNPDANGLQVARLDKWVPAIAIVNDGVRIPFTTSNDDSPLREEVCRIDDRTADVLTRRLAQAINDYKEIRERDRMSEIRTNKVLSLLASAEDIVMLMGVDLEFVRNEGKYVVVMRDTSTGIEYYLFKTFVVPRYDIVKYTITLKWLTINFPEINGKLRALNSEFEEAGPRQSTFIIRVRPLIGMSTQDTFLACEVSRENNERLKIVGSRLFPTIDEARKFLAGGV